MVRDIELASSVVSILYISLWIKLLIVSMPEVIGVVRVRVLNNSSIVGLCVVLGDYEILNLSL